MPYFVNIFLIFFNTIMHKVGHIVMKHIQNNPKYEYEAERFAIGILAPACAMGS